MPRTITKEVYKFNELPEEVQEKAINNYYNINLDGAWWESTYDDAKSIGLKLTHFDLDRNRHATGEFIDGAFNCANKITAEHGENCETFKTAKAFLAAGEALPEEGNGSGVAGNGRAEDYDTIEGDFLQSLLEDYSIILQNESEYLSSREAIIESIEANEYEFTLDGKRV